MMNSFIKSLSLTLIFLSSYLCAAGDKSVHDGDCPLPWCGDTTSVSSSLLSPDETGSSFFRAKLDSMANSWYIQKMFNNKLDFSVHHHDILSDSLIISRLQKAESAIKLSYNSIVRDYIETIVNRKPIQTEILLGLSAYYFPIFEEIFDRYNLPLELKYLAIIESALNPKAKSPAGAVGLWQFMYGTAKGLNLEVSTFIDERRDVLKSTEAAAIFLKKLYDVYHDWHLVIAAYNCGPGNVNKAIDRAGGKTDYWKIYFALPRETREFVPGYIATTYIMNYYREHHLTPRYPSLSLHTDTLIINKYLNLKQVSDNLKIDLESLRELNPVFRRDVIPGTPGKGYPLRIPVELVASFIEKQDTIFQYDREKLFPGNSVPQTKNVMEDYDIGNLEGKAKVMYTVKPGDNPGYIADWFDVSVAELRLWNRISRNLIRAGQKLVIYVPDNKSDYYRKINNLSFNAKQELSGYAVQENQAPPVSTTPATGSGMLAENSSIEYIYYTVQRGDNFWTISKKYPGVTNIEIMQLNNISDAGSLKVGQKLKIKPKT